MWRRCAGWEVFIAVGDERCQRMDMVGMLDHGHFIGLWNKTIWIKFWCKHYSCRCKGKVNELCSILCWPLVPGPAFSKQESSCVNALHGKHRVTSPVMQSGWAPRNTKKPCRHMPRALRLFSRGENCLFSPTRQTVVPSSPKSLNSDPQTNTKTKVNQMCINN